MSKLPALTGREIVAASKRPGLLRFAFARATTSCGTQMGGRRWFPFMLARRSDQDL